MKPERWRRIGGTTLTTLAAVFFLLWPLVAILIATSYWRADCVVVLLENRRFELSSAWGRFYVRTSEFFPEKVNPFKLDKDWGWGSYPNPSRIMQNMHRCKANIGGREVLLASVHLNANDFYEVRFTQAEQLLDFAGDSPAILAGDFNSEPNEPEIQRIVGTGRFCAKLDGPFTISSYDPHAIIDHIFVPRDWQLLEHKVIQTDLSDHLPVVSVYRVPLAAHSRPGAYGEDR